MSSSATPGAIVEVTDLRKTYEPSPLWMRALLRTAVREPVVALDGVSLKVHPGEICAIIGENGAGKSTLFRVLTGLTTPTSGSARILGYDVTSGSTSIRRSIGFMPAEQRSLLLRHTCRENLEFHGRLYGIAKSKLRGRISDTLELVGLTQAADRGGFALSSGMAARLMLARALLHKPSVLILDEPTGAVDPIGSYQLLELIQRLASEEGIAVLLSSHRLDEIEALHDHVILLDRGRIIYSGDLEHLRSLWERPRFEVEFLTAAVTKSAARLLNMMDQTATEVVDEHSLIVSTDLGLGALLRSLAAHIESVHSVKESRIGLHELLTRVVRAQRDREEASL